MKDARYHAFHILKIYYQKKDRLKTVRDNYFKNHTLSQNELNRSLVLSNEVVRWAGRLDYWINLKLDKSLRKLHPSIHLLLKLGYYEVLMDNAIPIHAAVNSWVELTKIIMGKKFVGLVNAVLRKTKQIDPTKREDGQSNGDWFSYPNWMVENWILQFGEEGAFALCEYYNKITHKDIRINTAKFRLKTVINEIDSLGISWERIASSDQFIRIQSGLGRLIKSNLFELGMFNMQDRASGAVVELLDPQAGETILDVCAAPGTKSGYIIERIKGDGQVFASDISWSRMNKGKMRSKELNEPIEWLNKDATCDEFPMADRILIDAPCTGTGVIGRHPDIRWRREKGDATSMAHIQMEILTNMAQYVKPRGTIIYSTCSLEREENWNVVESFLKLNNNFNLKSGKNFVPKPWLNSNQCLETFPPRDKVDGMFAAHLRKK